MPPVTVTNLNDSGDGSLRKALENAISGGTITFGVSGTIRLKSNLPIIKVPLTIEGFNIIIDCNNHKGLIIGKDAFGSVIEGLTIKYSCEDGILVLAEFTSKGYQNLPDISKCIIRIALMYPHGLW